MCMDETMDLIRRAHAGDEEAREQLVMGNVGLVWSVARHYSGRGHELEDLFQIGCIGLLKAVDKFDLGFQVRFSTYAVPMIAGEIRRFLRDDGMIRVSRSMKELGLRVRRARETLTAKSGREPGLSEIAKELDISCEEVAACMGAGAEVESLYRETGNGEEGGLRLMDRIPDGTQNEEQLMNRLVLKQLMEKLPEKDREIIVRRYFENQTQTRIAGSEYIPGAGVAAGKTDSEADAGISGGITAHTEPKQAGSRFCKEKTELWILRIFWTESRQKTDGKG